MLSLNAHDAHPLLLTEAERLEALAADLRLIQHLGGLPPDRLSEAPRLDDWSLAPAAAICLEGRVTGHPKLGDRRRIRTSDIWLVGEGGQWARTLSRVYVLGHPAKASDHD